MNTPDPVAWRVEMLTAKCPAPTSTVPDVMSAALHDVAVAFVAMGGAKDIDNAISVINGVSISWPEEFWPNHLEVIKASEWVIGRSGQQTQPKGKLDPLAQRLEAAIAGELVAVPWPWQSVGGLSQALMPGSVTIIVGTPGASKSFMLLQAAMHWLAEGLQIALYELEENPAFWLNRALAQLAETGGLTDPKWVAENPQISRQHLVEHGEALTKLAGCLHVAPHEGATLETLAQWVEEQAEAGARIIMADPITAAIETGKPWESSQRFMLRAKRAVSKHNASLIMTTHGKKKTGMDKGPPDLDSLAGGAAWARFASCVLWLEPIDGEHMSCMDTYGRDNLCYVNRKLRILKAREGRGTGSTIGMEFMGESLTLAEKGMVIKQDKPVKVDATHQSKRLKQKPIESEDVFNDTAEVPRNDQ
jgi:KaiC/GvpD/RAD55 family RecA-like ATPase